MIPAAFEYHAPKSMEEALRLLERHGDEAKLLAGGHSLLPLMKLRLAAPRYVIDIGRLRGLNAINEENGHIAIGALATHAEMLGSELLRARCPLLPETAAEIGDVQVRNRGTIGGSLAHADPAADYPAAILALDAELVAVSAKGPRRIAAREFFVDILTTQLRPGEILTEIRVPVQATGTGAAYRKLHHPASGYAVAGVAAVVQLDRSGVVERCAIGCTGVAPHAYRAAKAEASLAGKKPTAEHLRAAAELAAQGVEVLSDPGASSEYRAAMAAVYAQRALEAAAGRAAGKAK